MKFREANLIKYTTTAALALFIAAAPRANPINDQVAALTESQRQTIFSGMTQREGEKCPSVNRTYFQGTSKDGAVFWSVSCTGGKDWQLMIKNTAQGNVRILDCGTIKSIGGGTCFSAFKRK